MSQSMTIDPAKQGFMDTVALNGSESASKALTKWFGRNVQVTAGGFDVVPLEKLSSRMCEPEDIIIAVHTLIRGALDGHVLLALPEDVAFGIADCLMQQPEGTTKSLGEIERSAIQETGNLVSSAFINSLANSLGVRAMPTAPTVLHDMAGAIIQPLVIEQAATSNHALMISATFKIDDTKLDWWLFVLPDPKTLKVMEALLT